jgi:hypothetical protein
MYVMYCGCTGSTEYRYYVPSIWLTYPYVRSGTEYGVVVVRAVLSSPLLLLTCVLRNYYVVQRYIPLYAVHGSHTT